MYLQVVQADPLETRPDLTLKTRADSDHIHQHALIAGYMQLASSKCWSIIRRSKLLGLFQLTHTSPDIHTAKTYIASSMR